jgi:hypothetical protein
MFIFKLIPDFKYLSKCFTIPKAYSEAAIGRRDNGMVKNTGSLEDKQFLLQY